MNKAELDEEWRRWRTWLRGGIRQDVMTMLASRQVWRRYSELVQPAPQLVQRNRTFHTWVTHNYLDGIGTGIRRQTDLREDVIALARLLHRVARYPQALSRDRFASDDESESRLSADEAFDEPTSLLVRTATSSTQSFQAPTCRRSLTGHPPCADGLTKRWLISTRSAADSALG